MTRGMVWALLIVVLAIQISLSVPALAQQKPEELAEQSAETWLALNDSGKYADSYDQAAAYFKNAITSDQWQRSMHAVRDPLGKVLSRKLTSATYTKTLPSGLPRGHQRATRLTGSRSCRAKDGTWMGRWSPGSTNHGSPVISSWWNDDQWQSLLGVRGGLVHAVIRLSADASKADRAAL